jgi:hypothetical protein
MLSLIMRPKSLKSRPWSQVDLSDAISAAIIEDHNDILGSCRLVFSLLQERLKKFNLDSLDKVDKATAWSKLKYTWREQGIQKVQSNIHGLVGSLKPAFDGTSKVKRFQISKQSTTLIAR